MAECSGKNCTLIKKLLDSEALNCQSCKNLLQIPVFLVDSVGNVCEHCTLENEWKQGIRNEIFNVFLEELIVPCTNAPVGCDEEIPYKHFEEHSKLCKYRPVKCPNQDCTWMERQGNLLNHFAESHEENVIESDTFYFDLKFHQEEPIINFAKLLIKRHFKYLFILKQDEANNDELACTLFKFHKDAPSSTTVMFRSTSQKECYSVKINVDLLDLIDQDCSVEKIDLRTIKSILHADNNELSMIVDLPPADFLLQNLECPICKEAMGPPIFQCSKGHTVCKDCVNRLQKCPSCTAVISKDIRNYHLESVASKMFYSCAYKDAGCTTILSGDAIMDHEPNCLYHLYKCPLDCSFQYNSKTVLFHLKSKHKNVSNKCYIKLKAGSPTLEQGKSKPFMYIDGIFFQFTYSEKVIYGTNSHVVHLEFKQLNLDQHIDDLYCKITLRNIRNQASFIHIQYLNRVCNSDNNNCYSISVPTGVLADHLHISRTPSATLVFKCELESDNIN